MRNSIIYLLEIFEILIDEPSTFHRIRSRVVIGYNPLKKLLDKFIEDGLIEVINKDDKILYSATTKMFEIFSGSFYSGIKELYDKK